MSENAIVLVSLLGTVCIIDILATEGCEPFRKIFRAIAGVFRVIFVGYRRDRTMSVAIGDVNREISVARGYRRGQPTSVSIGDAPYDALEAYALYGFTEPTEAVIERIDKALVEAERPRKEAEWKALTAGHPRPQRRPTGRRVHMNRLDPTFARHALRDGRVGYDPETGVLTFPASYELHWAAEEAEAPAPGTVYAFFTSEGEKVEVRSWP